jgi:hypothetical protein
MMKIGDALSKCSAVCHDLTSTPWMVMQCYCHHRELSCIEIEGFWNPKYRE